MRPTLRPPHRTVTRPRRPYSLRPPRAVSNRTVFMDVSTPRLSCRLPCSRQYAAVATSPTSPDPRELTPASPFEPIELPSIKGAEEIIPVLHGIRTLLQDEIGGADQWPLRVKSAMEDLSSKRMGRLGIFGDHLAGPSDITSALLRDPLTDTEASREALETRHVGADTEVLNLRYGTESVKIVGCLSVPSSWLQASGYDIVEVQTSDEASALSCLLSADVVILVLDPFRLLSLSSISNVLSSLREGKSVHFVVNGHLPPNVTEGDVAAKIRRQMAELATKSNGSDPAPSILFVRASRALRALDALATGLSTEGALSHARADAFDTFQREYLRSGIGPLQSSLLSVTSQNSAPQLSTAIDTAHLALDHVTATVSADRTATHTASRMVDELRHSASGAALKARHASVINRGIEGGVVEGDVQYEMNRARIDLEEGFNGRWNWLALIARLRVDDVGVEIGAYLDRRFGKTLEQQVIFETGELSQIQTMLSIQSDHIIRQLSSQHKMGLKAPHPFSSPLLLNHLQTMSLSVPPFEPASLLDPIASRRQQLLRFSVPRLQLSAQRSLLSTWIVGLIGVSASWVAYVPPISMFSASTATGLALLSVVSAAALGQRLWIRAQHRFWRDWVRLTHMLKGDLRTRFSAALESQVLAKPSAAADGLEKLVTKRENRLNELQIRVDDLRRRLYPA